MQSSSRRTLRDAAAALAPVSRSSPAPGSRLAALRHPAFLAALALLLVNDHLLKGAGLLPGAITGKLSDLAGLIVAPVLAAAIAGRSVRARALAFAAVAAPFAAIKLSTAAASALVTLVGLAGIRWRIWTDPTDLVALVMLVPAWRLAGGAALTRPRPSERAAAGATESRAAWALERTSLAIAAVACVATSSPPVGYFTDAYVYNPSPFRRDVRIRWADASVNCETLESGDPVRMFGPSAFNLGKTYKLEGFDTAPLNRRGGASAFEGGEGGGDGEVDRPCDVALIESDGIRPVMVWWSNLPSIEIPLNAVESPDGWEDGAEYLRGRVELLPTSVRTPGSVSQGALQTNVPPSFCASTPQSSFQWTSPFLNLPTVVEIVNVDVLPDGCLDLSLVTSQFPFGGGGAGGAGVGGAGQGGSGGEGGSGGSGGEGGSGGAGGGGAGQGGSGGEGGQGGSGVGGAGGGEPAVIPIPMFLCIPFEDFPFSAGDKVQLQDEGRHLRVSDLDTGKAIDIYQGYSGVELGGLFASVALTACEGDRLPCGAYVTDAELEISTSSGKTFLAVGETFTGPDFRVRVGRAERVLVGREECNDGYQTPIVSADFLIAYE